MSFELLLCHLSPPIYENSPKLKNNEMLIIENGISWSSFVSFTWFLLHVPIDVKKKTVKNKIVVKQKNTQTKNDEMSKLP